MEVLKRDGSTEPVKLDKITARIKKQTYDLNQDYVDYMEVVKKTISGLHDGITTTELDNLAAETAASLSSIHPDYSLLSQKTASISMKRGYYPKKRMRSLKLMLAK